MTKTTTAAAAPRTTTAMLGDMLAAAPEKRFATKDLIAALRRDRSGINQAVQWLNKAGAVQIEADPEDRRRNVVFMSEQQAQAWRADGGAAAAAAGRFNLFVAPAAAASAVATTRQAAERRELPLRLGVWDDGAMAIEGLARTQLKLEAKDTGALADTLAALPEGAMQALMDSPLRPSFQLHISGRYYPLTADQAQQLVDYVERLPRRLVRAASFAAAAAGLPEAGTNHRVHRMETPADGEPA